MTVRLVDKEGLVCYVLDYVTPSGKSGSVTINPEIKAVSTQVEPPRYRFGFEEE